jgi:hypothetical protein
MLSDHLEHDYERLTPAVLRNLPDAKMLDMVFSNAVVRMGEEFEPRPELLDALPEALEAVYAVAYYVSEATNDGLRSFVSHSYEPSAKRALKGLLWFGALDHAALLREAIENETSDDRVFADLDNRYRRLPDVLEIMEDTIRRNPERFCYPP